MWFSNPGGLGAAPATPIRTLKRQLAAIGFQLQPDGVLDSPTVSAINSVLQGWDDAPARFKTGRLTRDQIAREIRTVSGLIKRAVGGATGYDQLPE